MAKFLLRRFTLLLLTMLLVSVAVFLITEASPGNVAKNVLGAFITPEQEASFLAQMGFDKPIHIRYIHWLVGSDWLADGKVGLPLERVTNANGFVDWYAVRPNGDLVRWKLAGEDLIAVTLPEAGGMPSSRWTTGGGRPGKTAPNSPGGWIRPVMSSAGKKAPTWKSGPLYSVPAG